MMVFLRFLEVLEGLERSVGVEKSLFGAELRFFWHRRSIPRWREHGKCLAPLEAHKTLVQILRHNRTQPCAQPSYAERTSAHNPCAYNPRSWTHNEFFSVENSSRGGISTGGRCRWTIISKCQWSLKSRVRPKHCFFLFLFFVGLGGPGGGFGAPGDGFSDHRSSGTPRLLLRFKKTISRSTNTTTRTTQSNKNKTKYNIGGFPLFFIRFP